MTEENSEDDNAKIWEYRTEVYRGIIKEQFYLAYFGRVSYSDTDEMDIGERKVLYNILLEQKDEERKQQEQAIENAKHSRGSSGWRRK